MKGTDWSDGPARRAGERALRAQVAADLRRGRLHRNYLTEQFVGGQSLAQVAHGAGLTVDEVAERLTGEGQR